MQSIRLDWLGETALTEREEGGEAGSLDRPSNLLLNAMSGIN